MKTPVKAAKKIVPAKKSAPLKKAAPPKKSTPAKKVVVTKKAAPVKKSAPAKRVAPVKKAAPIKATAPAKKVIAKPVLKVATKPAKTLPPLSPAKAAKAAAPTPAPAAVATAAPAPLVKPPKARKGADKNYVAPPTVVLVQTSAKLVHTPTGLGQVLNPAVIPAPIKKNAKLAANWKSKKPHELTDAEVIAMPDEEYMNKTQLAFFKFKLSELRDSILKSASETTEHMRDDSAVVPDPTDRATIEEEHALELRTRDRERKLLKKIQQSLTRIDQDDYGYCDETGEPIGVSRLIARPTASLSLEAQQRRERDEADALGGMLGQLGFAPVARHSRKDVTRWTQGSLNLVINSDPDGFASSFDLVHGASVCAIGLRVTDVEAYSRT